MGNRNTASCLKITSNARGLVKCALTGSALLFAFTSLVAQASATESPIPRDTEESVFLDQDLPDIEARKFEVRISKMSRSKTVYLLDDDTSARPSPGKIILLKRDTAPVMAFRVLRIYDERRQLAARRIRLYNGIVHLEPGESYDAIEKLADIVPLPPSPETVAEDKKELDEFEEELEQETGEIWSAASDQPAVSLKRKQKQQDDLPPAELVAAEYDPELDAESSPPPSGSGLDFEEELLEDEPNSYGIASEDSALLEPHRHLVSAGAGWAFNRQRSDAMYTAGGFRYSYAVKRLMLLRAPRIQDALSFEGSMFLYKPIYNEGSYSVIPWTGSLRYEIQSARGFTFYGYVGFVWNAVIPGPGTLDSNTGVSRARDLQGLRPAGGIGFLFPFGPNWNVRANIGAESLDMALALRF